MLSSACTELPYSWFSNKPMTFKVGALGNLAKTLYESKKLLKFIETVNILLTQINIQEKG